MSKVIGKNRKKLIEKIFADADPTTCKVYSLSNGFTGVECSMDSAHIEWATTHCSKLLETDQNTYTVQIHSNLWYTFKTKNKC